MACDKIKILCKQCDYFPFRDKCPGVNYWRKICGIDPLPEDQILTEVPSRVFGVLFKNLLNIDANFNLMSLSSNKVSHLSRNECISILHMIRNKFPNAIQSNYIHMKTEDMKKTLYALMKKLYENGNNI